MSLRALIPVVLTVSLAADAAAADQKGRPLGIDSMMSSDLYQFYCATCHGRDGKGAGPVAAALKTPPANLTVIARRHGGQFPRADMIAFVSGRKPAVTAHGPSDMPVWGPIFRGLDPSAIRADIRIENLVSYIESIQEK